MIEAMLLGGRKLTEYATVFQTNTVVSGSRFTSSSRYTTRETIRTTYMPDNYRPTYHITTDGSITEYTTLAAYRQTSVITGYYTSSSRTTSYTTSYSTNTQAITTRWTGN